MGEVALATIESRHDMGALHPSLEAVSTSRSGDPSPQLVAKPLFEEPDALSANVDETLTPHSITVGRWKVKTDDSREEVDDVERASRPRAWG